MRKSTGACVLLSILTCLTCAAGTENDGTVLLTRATRCLAEKSVLAHAKAPTLYFGYFLDAKSSPGERMLYIVNYPNRSKRGGFAYTLFVGERGGRQFLDVQNNASFILSKGGDYGVSFLNPPLGGTWTQEHLARAIREIEERPRVAISIRDVRRADSSFICEAYTDRH